MVSDSMGNLLFDWFAVTTHHFKRLTIMPQLVRMEVQGYLNARLVGCFSMQFETLAYRHLAHFPALAGVA